MLHGRGSSQYTYTLAYVRQIALVVPASFEAAKSPVKVNVNMCSWLLLFPIWVSNQAVHLTKAHCLTADDMQVFSIMQWCCGRALN